MLKSILSGTFVVVQWLEICLAMTQVRSLVGELRSHMLCNCGAHIATFRESVRLNRRSCMMQRRAFVPQLRPITAKSINKCQYFFKYNSVQFSSVQSLSRVQLFTTSWTAARQASLSITNSQSQASHLLSSPSPPAFNLSQHQGLFK